MNVFVKFILGRLFPMCKQCHPVDYIRNIWWVENDRENVDDVKERKLME